MFFYDIINKKIYYMKKEATSWEFYINEGLLCLWKNLFIEKAENIEISLWKDKILLFNENTVNIIHELVKKYYTLYEKVINLFIPLEKEYIKYIIKYYKKEQKKEQVLNIFPDLISIYHFNKKPTIPLSNISKIKYFFQVTSWEINEINTTRCCIFIQPSYLKKVTIYFPHKRYYKNSQDPRYNTIEVLEIFKKYYKFEIVKIYDFSI